jgi:hypothetical protein
MLEAIAQQEPGNWSKALSNTTDERLWTYEDSCEHEFAVLAPLGFDVRYPTNMALVFRFQLRVHNIPHDK